MGCLTLHNSKLVRREENSVALFKYIGLILLMLEQLFSSWDSFSEYENLVEEEFVRLWRRVSFAALSPPEPAPVHALRLVVTPFPTMLPHTGYAPLRCTPQSLFPHISHQNPWFLWAHLSQMFSSILREISWLKYSKCGWQFTLDISQGVFALKKKSLLICT